MSLSPRHLLSDLAYRCIGAGNGADHGLRILMYHRVTDAHPADRLCVPVARFAEQMHLLHEAGYRSLDMTAATKALIRRGPWPPRSVVIPFDDASRTTSCMPIRPCGAMDSWDAFSSPAAP